MANRDPVIIVGGGFAGISMAHSILNHIQPTPKVILVSASQKFWFKVATPRILVRPDLVSAEQCSPDIAPAFVDYPAIYFSFVYAYARDVNVEEKTLEVELIDHAKTKTCIKYAALVVATGARSQDVMWSPEGPLDGTKQRLSLFSEGLKTAESVVIGGGGSLGVEAAGEIGSEYGGKMNIKLYSGSSRLLSNERSSLGRDAEHFLKKLGVRVIHNIKIKEDKEDEATRKRILYLDNGETVIADYYIPTTGLHPNNEFLPDWILNSNGLVEVDDYLRVKEAPGIYAIGSVASYSRGVIPDILDAVTPLTNVLAYDLYPETNPKPVEFHRCERETLLVPVGRSKGVGLLFGVKIPSFMVWAIKGRTFFVGSIPTYLNGDKFK
ncbi:hypothetical protein KEM54_005166 [Ascosphaera aggregata]|nr:hypothetical protein KEM54_005166 [Ascosphaera aggregata]